MALIWPRRLPSGGDGPAWEDSSQEAAVAFSDDGLCGEDSVLSWSATNISSGSKIPNLYVVYRFVVFDPLKSSQIWAKMTF